MLFYFHSGDISLWFIFFALVIACFIVWMVWGMGIADPPQSNDEKVNPLLSRLKDDEKKKDE
ncbi:MAG: hypothetical protein M3384_21805 [Acidobacteriota bacterium]|nr:hypothetical protein [Acidobacteriota bacterium]